MEFLNCQKLKYDWGNDELEADDGLLTESQHPEIPVQFLGIELESEVGIGAMSAMTVLEVSTEQEAHEAEVNGGLIEPTKEAPSPVDIIVIKDDGADDEIAGVQECSIKQEHVEAVNADDDEDVDDVTKM